MNSQHARHPSDPIRFYIDFLPFKHRQIRRDGIQLFQIHYWDNILSPLAGRSDRPYLIRYNPRDLSMVFVKGVLAGGYASIPYRDLAHPPISLVEQRAAMKSLGKQTRAALTEDVLFKTIESQRLLIESACAKTLSARRRIERIRAVMASRKTESVDDEYALVSECVEPYPIETWDE